MPKPTKVHVCNLRTDLESVIDKLQLSKNNGGALSNSIPNINSQSRIYTSAEFQNVVGVAGGTQVIVNSPLESLTLVVIAGVVTVNGNQIPVGVSLSWGNGNDAILNASNLIFEAAENAQFFLLSEVVQ